MNQEEKGFQIRLLAIGLFLGLGLLIALGKSFQLQVSEGEKLRDLSERRHLRSFVYEATRGNIYDRNGLLLATTTPLSSVYAQPKHLENPLLAAKTLGKLFPHQKKSIREKLSSNKSFVWLARRISPKIAAKVKELNLSGIGLSEENKRHYPNYTMASQTLGMVSIDEEGMSGLEKKYEADLTPSSWKSLIYHDAKGRALKPHPAPEPESLAGKDLHLTLDRNLQFATEKYLLDKVEEENARGGWAITLDPNTGDILSLANVPQDNPNEPNRQFRAHRRNSVLSTTFEPGSLFKMVTFTSALNRHKIDLEEKIDCEGGTYKIGGFTVHDVSKKDLLTPEEIFKFSSNVGTLKVAERIGAKDFLQDISFYGFGKLPGLNMLEEAKGKLLPEKKIGPVELATMSYGYGLSTTTLQLALFASAIANGGELLTPKLVKNSKVEKKRIFSKAVAKTMQNFMIAVAGKEGTAKLAQIEGITVAGKTGTTEKWNDTAKKYDSKRNYASFIGFAPAENPKIVAMVVIDEPQHQRFGGQVAAPVWRDIVTYALAGGSLQ